MSFETDLDKYLTTPPDDGFDVFCEGVIEAISDSFFFKNDIWIIEAELSADWLEKLFIQNRLNANETFSHCANVIERAFNIYVKNK